MDFLPSTPLSIGVEIELQLLDAQSLDLTDRVLPLIELFPDRREVKPEFTQSTVEISTPPCPDLASLESSLSTLVSEVRERAAGLGIRLCGAGTHPFSERLALITPLPRYQRLHETAGYLAHLHLIFSMHVHVGISSGDEAVMLMRRLKPFLPVLIALSASSPFWRGYDTAFASYRHRILAANRSYGMPPNFDDWQHFTQFLDGTLRAGVFESINDIHWDIRPRPRLGTLAVRAMDVQPTVTDVVALAGLVRALVAFLRDTPEPDMPGHLPGPLPWWVEKDNHFLASRFGLDASYIRDAEGNVRPLREVAEGLVGTLQVENGGDAGTGLWSERVCRLLRDGPAYLGQRRLFRESGSLRRVVEALVEAGEAG